MIGKLNFLSSGPTAFKEGTQDIIYPGLKLFAIYTKLMGDQMGKGVENLNGN